MSLEEQCPLSQKSGRKYAFRYDRLSDRLVLYLCPFLQWPCAFPCAARHASPEMATVSSRTITFHCNASTACCYRPLHSAAKPAARGPRGAPHGIRNHLPRLLPSGAPGGSWDSTFSSRAAGSCLGPFQSTQLPCSARALQNSTPPTLLHPFVTALPAMTALA